MVILYDSKCGFCQGFINFFDKKTRKMNIEKYDLRSREAKEILRGKGVHFIKLNTIYFVDDAVATKSKAVFNLLRLTRFPYNMAYMLHLLPTSFTDYCYDYIAKHRYKLSRLLNFSKA